MNWRFVEGIFQLNRQLEGREFSCRQYPSIPAGWKIQFSIGKIHGLVYLTFSSLFPSLILH